MKNKKLKTAIIILATIAATLLYKWAIITGGVDTKCLGTITTIDECQKALSLNQANNEL